MKRILFLSVLLFSTALHAADPAAPAATGKAPEWMKYTVPGDGQKALNDTVGKFSYSMKWWNSADAKPEESKGTSVSKWVLDGRFVQQEITGKSMGQPFKGMGFTGYDNLKQEYQSTWMDSMSTAILYTAGPMTAAKTIEQSGTVSDPMKGEKNAAFKTQLKILSKNEHTFSMFSKGADGKEFKAMEISYKRIK